MRSTFSGKSIDAVRDVSFTCSPGRVFTLLGPNGAGKTTILRIIAPMLRPTSGAITVVEVYLALLALASLSLWGCGKWFEREETIFRGA